MAIPVLQDLPRSPVNLSDEYKKHNDLILKTSPLTTAGDATWTSISSTLTYLATTGGEAQLLDMLKTKLDNYILNANKWNVISQYIEEQSRVKSFMLGGM